jgi:DNA mismatch repair protein MutS
VIDKTLSPMGGRLLKRWLALPLKRPIKLKPPSSGFLFERKSGGPVKTQNQIKQISDLERLISKIAAGKVSPVKIYLKESLDAIIPSKL